MPRVLIIGYGNPLKSDDGLGWHAAHELSRHASSPEVKVIYSHQLTPEMAEEVSHAELAIFIDARQGGTPGEVNCVAVSQGEGEQQPPLGSGTHDISPRVILELAGKLYGNSPLAYLLTVSGEDFDDGESLSQAVASALPNVIAVARNLISKV